MNDLKYKNALHAILFGACFASAIIILFCIICVSAAYALDQTEDNKLGLIIFGSFLAGTWLIASLCLLFGKTVVITSEEISMYRWKKIKWSIKKEEIEECIYNKLNWYDCFFPTSTLNAFALQFKLTDRGISKKFCSLSLKQVKRIQKEFGYPVRVISDIWDQ